MVESLYWLENDLTVDVVGFYDNFDISEVKWYVENYEVGSAKIDPMGHSLNKMFKLSFPLEILSHLYKEPLDGSIISADIKAVDSDDESRIYIETSIVINNSTLSDY